LQLYVLDRYLQPVPIGIPGELHVGGAGLARGYLNRSDLTNERFIPNPFSPLEGERLYKSGDLVRYLPEQDLEYLGRIDLQVKIRGFRIELGEIESVLMRNEAVRDVVVIVREDNPGDKRLVAYLIAAGEHAVSVSDLRHYVKQELPEYMVPSAFMMLEQFPLTPNGKIDRRALPVPDADRQTETGYIAPRNEVEESIAGIWRELLNMKNVGVNDSFFEVGGHSLLLVRLHANLQMHFQKKWQITEMFRHTTIAALADFLTQKEEIEPSLEKSLSLAEKQKSALKMQKKMAMARRQNQ
jgi:acyl carrier protein